MRLIKPSFEIIDKIDPIAIYKKIELIGRTCYGSEKKITENSYKDFIKMIMNKKHYSVIEHEKISVKIICDRGVSHELVRHRLASYSQESTRYCNYSKDKFDNQLTFILPPWIDSRLRGNFNPKKTQHQLYRMFQPASLRDYNNELLFLKSCSTAECCYFEALELGQTPQQARSILPNSLKTEIVMTTNLRHWIEIFKQRTAKVAHPQMREIMIPLEKEFKKLLPLIFD